jgi:oxepin-CoA hydrolase/3-oxo-5,6-dehydrosuberyl-CoA semialdehyde dehydrogenase
MITAITQQYQQGARMTHHQEAHLPHALRGAERGRYRDHRQAPVTLPTSRTSPTSAATSSTRTWTPNSLDGTIFTGRVAHGYFILSRAAGLFVDPPKGPVLLNYGIEECRFVKPVYPGHDHPSEVHREGEGGSGEEDSPQTWTPIRGGRRASGHGDDGDRQTSWWM